MYTRLELVSQRLEWLGLEHKIAIRQMLQRLAGPASPEELTALRTLADVVEPVKDYTRQRTAPAPPSSQTPLNRLVDAVPLESHVGRRFNELVDNYLASSCRDPAAESRLRMQLSLWRDNDSNLQSLMSRSFLVKEIAPTSQDLSAIATTGLAALDAIGKGLKTDDAWKSQHTVILTQAQKPKSQLLIIPVSGVQKLVDSAAGGGCPASK
jgi:hexosaminidase